MQKLFVHDVLQHLVKITQSTLCLLKQWIKFSFLHADPRTKRFYIDCYVWLALLVQPIRLYCGWYRNALGSRSWRRNEAVLSMLEEIGDVDNIDTFIAKAKDKNDPFRLMGFGHRVYKNFDPRAKVMRETCDQVLAELGQSNDPLLKIAKRLEADMHLKIHTL